MTRPFFVMIFLFLFVLLTNGLVYAEHECDRTVVCSDGTEIITTHCMSSYSIIDGDRIDDDSDGPDGLRHRHHHDDDFDDPCHLGGHGHRVDINSDINSAIPDVPDAPYSLTHGHHHDYDPDDPYGLRRGRHQTVNETLTNQSQ